MPGTRSCHDRRSYGVRLVFSRILVQSHGHRCMASVLLVNKQHMNHRGIIRTQRFSGRFVLSTTILTACVFALLSLSPRPAFALAKWTIITVMGAEYADMKERLLDTGSTDDVNVLVMHSNEGTNMDVYRLLKDPNSSHPIGQCCPNNQGPCCQAQDIPLSTIGIQGTSVNAYNVNKLYQYAQQKYPAERYLLIMRGHMLTARLLNSDVGRGNGIGVTELADILRQFVQRNGGKKVDVLNIGLCLGGNIDWSYAMAPYVNYYVGSPQYSVSPIAMRWRVYRWVRDIIEKPTISSRSVATNIVNIFKETSTYCSNAGHNCSKARDGIPWTAAAYDLSQAPVMQRTMREFVCSMLSNYDGGPVSTAYNRATKYGISILMPESGRRDLKHFMTLLRANLRDANKQAAIDSYLNAQSKYVIKSIFESGYYNNESHGIAAFFDLGKYANAQEIGPWQLESLWKVLLDKHNRMGGLPSPSKIVIDASTTEIAVGKSLTLVTRGFANGFGATCALPGIKWSVDKSDVASLSSTTSNPVSLKAIRAGTVRVRATYSGMSAETNFAVKSTVAAPPSDTTDADGDPAPDDDGDPTTRPTDDVEGNPATDGDPDNEDPNATLPIATPEPEDPENSSGVDIIELSAEDKRLRALATDGCNCTLSGRSTSTAPWIAALVLGAFLGLRRMPQRSRKPHA